MSEPNRDVPPIVERWVSRLEEQVAGLERENRRLKRLLAITLATFALVATPLVGWLTRLSVPRSLDRPRTLRVEGMTNLMNIALVMERRFVGGTFSYTDGSGHCPGKASYGVERPEIADLHLTITGASHAYDIEVADPDGDGLCEWYLLTATGIVAPVKGHRLSYDQRGVKGGDWRR